jgi:FeS assembly SUF system protein
MSDQNEKAKKNLEMKVIKSLKEIYDPEIPVNIYELGLIYEVKIEDPESVYVKMTLTSPTCPVAESLPPEVKENLKEIPGVKNVNVEITWDPPWSPERMSEAAKLQLGMF